MINHLFANKIETARDLGVYFLENAEVGDTVIACRPFAEHRIIAIHTTNNRVFYWVQYEDDIPVTLGAGDMDSNRKVVPYCVSRSEYGPCDHTECAYGAVCP